MRTVTRAVAVGVFAAAVAVTTSTASPALAAPAANGASIVVEQNGIVTHQVCASQDVVLVATGFAPNRKVVAARVQIVGSGVLFSTNIQLSAGSGSLDIGAPGPTFVGEKFRVRYQVGSGNRPALLGSFSATVFGC
jgi:hypothetical protein